MSARDATESIEQLLHSLEKLGPQLQDRQGDLQFLRDMLNSNEFQSILTVHQEVSKATAAYEDPISLNAIVLANMVAYDAEEGGSAEEKELSELLYSPHVQALISTHDRVANKEYPLQSVVAVETDEETGLVEEKPTTIVRIDKKTDPLGATVRPENDGSITISRVLCGGAADRSGLIHPGDILHEINGVSVAGKTVDQIADIMQDLVGTVVFRITPAMGETMPRKKTSQPRVHVRTFFAYDPDEDRHNPCKEAGLKFERGAILRVVNQDDPDWWQAVREGRRGERAGLIPSRNYKERLASYSNHGNGRQQQRRHSKGKKRQYAPNESEKFGNQLITYEEMVKIEPQVDRPRPILLVAPRGKPFDVNTLRSSLLKEQPGLFDKPVTHASRNPRPNERNGRDFHFVSRQQMERDIRTNRFVEHGFLDGNYYGTSIDSVRNVVNSGKTCLLTLLPESIKYARIPEIRPFIIYLHPPSQGYMRQYWVTKGLIRESHVADILRQAAYIERSYGHYIDHALTYTDTRSVVQEVVGVANRLQATQQWVPASWTTN